MSIPNPFQDPNKHYENPDDMIPTHKNIIQPLTKKQPPTFLPPILDDSMEVDEGSISDISEIGIKS